MARSSPQKRRRAPPAEDTIVVGRITGPWGLHGDVKVEPHTDYPDRFSVGSLLLLDGRPATVVRTRSYRSGFVVRFDRVSDRTEAEGLRGAFLTAPLEDARPLPAGSYYHYQIIDIDVWTDSGEHLGEVKEILTTGSNDVYVVRGPGDSEVLVPALGSVVLSIDPGQNRMVVRLPEGLR